MATSPTASTAPTPRTARTARERVREEMTAEILAVARAHLADEGAAALSLRSVARDLELAPSALYRYFDGRDALLSALIMAAYESLAVEAEGAADRAQPQQHDDESGTDTERWLEVPRAIRRWALERPHEWGLIFGTPVPGYEAPEGTVEPYARVATALARPVIEAQAAGRLRIDAPGEAGPAELRRAVAPVAEGLSLEMLPVPMVARFVQAWTTLVGVISLEIFGHWRNTILDPEAFFEATMRDVAGHLGLT